MSPSQDVRYSLRTHWNAYEPVLIAEALFAVANIFSFARIIYLFQMNPYLGPLQVNKLNNHFIIYLVIT